MTTPTSRRRTDDRPADPLGVAVTWTRLRRRPVTGRASRRGAVLCHWRAAAPRAADRGASDYHHRHGSVTGLETATIRHS